MIEPRIFRNSRYNSNIIKTANDFYQLCLKKRTKISVRDKTENLFQTGFDKLDELTGGFYSGDLILLTGEPAIGKTSFLINVLHNNICGKNIPVLFISLTQRFEQIMFYLLSLKKNISVIRNFPKNEDSYEWLDYFEKSKLAAAKLYIDSTEFNTIDDIINSCDAIVKEKEMKLIIIDSLDDIIFDRDKKNYVIEPWESEIDLYMNRMHNIKSISESLKELAVKYEIPILLSATTNQRYSNKLYAEIKPIEQYADVILNIYKSSYFGTENNEDDNNVLISVVKNNNGQIGGVKFVHNDRKQKFDVFNEEIIVDASIDFDANINIKTDKPKTE